MRLVLVDNFILPAEDELEFLDVHPNLGLISLAAVGEAAGHRVEIYDPKYQIRAGRHGYDATFYDKAARDIQAMAPDAVGFTTLGCSFLFAINVAAALHQSDPDLPILLGGPHATMLDRRSLELYRQFDIVVRHEAELALPELLNKIETRDFGHIPGVTWRGAGGAIRATPGSPKVDDLDSLPLPLYEKYPVAELGLDMMRIEAGRGCPFECTFCSTATFFQRTYRLKSPERLLAEMDRLNARYGVTEFKLDHDLFTVNKAKVAAFCEAVQDRDYQWRVSARTDCVDPPLLEQMAAAGCIGLYFGIESGSTRLQRTAKKRLKLDSVAPILDTAQSLGIEATVSFITGFPDESAADHDDTLDMLGRCFQRPSDECLPQLHLLQPEPGTALMERYKDRLTFDGRTTKFNARVLRAGDRDLIAAAPDMFSTYYYYPSVLPRTHLAQSVEAVDALRVGGNEVLAYAMRYFDGRLSRLIAALRDWLDSRQAGAAPDPDLVLAFFADRFGAEHHLVSLYRYAGTLRRAPAPQVPPAPAPGAARFRRNPNAHLFTDLHNCPDLMRRIRDRPLTDGPLSEDEVGPRGSYMTVRGDDRETHFQIDPGLVHILRLFETPRTLDAAAAALAELTGAADADPALFQGLVEIGALVPASDPAPAADRVPVPA